jgi:hypothetical protein
LRAQCTAASGFGFCATPLFFVFSCQALNFGILTAEESFVMLFASLKFIANSLDFRPKPVEILN